MEQQMRNLLITLQYDGTNYHGFQVQENAVTVCQVFQDAVENVLQKRWDVKGCSRTDTGVHALDYHLSMVVDHPIPCDRLRIALNRKLPDDIAVTKIQEVPLDFHARYHCIGKQYTYRIHNSSIKNPFEPTHMYRYPWLIDEKILHQEAQVLVGTHDFSAFCTRADLVDDTIRTITAVSVLRYGDEIRITIEGDGFLYNMVRIIVGSLLAITAGRIKPGELEEILASGDRSRSGKTAPAHGLYLTRIDYPILGEENENAN